MVDIMAFWYLMGEPKINPASIGANMSFGFRETFSGVGVFIYKEGTEFKVVAMENHGNE